MPETTEDEAQPNGPSPEVPFHYVLTVQYAVAGNEGQLVAQTLDGVAFVRPGYSRAAAYQEIVDTLRAELPGDPDSIAVLFFEFSPERLVA
jgi:hypothetical protein